MRTLYHTDLDDDEYEGEGISSSPGRGQEGTTEGTQDIQLLQSGNFWVWNVPLKERFDSSIPLCGAMLEFLVRSLYRKTGRTKLLMPLSFSGFGHRVKMVIT